MRPLPPLFFLISVLLMTGLHMILPGPRWLPAPWNSAGILVVILGLATTAFSANLFQRYETAIRPFEEARVLVQAGPFRWSRNPMYLGMVLALVGLGVLLGTATPLVIPALFGLLLHFRFVLREERLLLRQFGEEYESYRRKVRRWV